MLTQDGSRSIRRERVLLSLGAAFYLVGTLALTLARSVADEPLPSPARWLAAVLSFALAFGGLHLSLNRLLPRRDPFLLPTAALLTGWGLLLIGRLAPNFLLRQSLWLLLSAGALVAVVRLSRDMRRLRRFRYTWLLGGLALLAATLVFGVNPSGYGPRLWLGVGGVYLQPAEILKLLLTIYLASYLAEKGELLTGEEWRVWRGRLPQPAYVGPLLAMLGLTLLLLARQQDLGAAMLFFLTFLAMLYLATGRRSYVVVGLALFVGMGFLGYHLSERVALRIDGWLDPWPGAADRSFQIVQSLLAFGAGGVFGQGLGLGHPTFIPAVHTDFIFAAIGEEFGLAGVTASVALYGLLLLRGFRAAVRAAHPFARFLAAGLTSGLTVQAWVIMAGNAKLAPITGVTLPFVSYGGSSLLTNFIALGLLLRVSADREMTVAGDGRERALLLRLAAGLTLALALLTIGCGYWAVLRAGELSRRDDNPRRVLYERHIIRGRILDRHGVVLADTEVAADGLVTRRYPLPEAAPVVGYASLRYGTGGIEAACDDLLRGETARTPWQAAVDDLLHRPPHGADVRLTLDARLQAQAQRALEGQAGAVVLLDAADGEILALASAPTFDPERLDEEWEQLSDDPAAPLVNRATQGLYQPGAALQTVILAESLVTGVTTPSAPVRNATAVFVLDGESLACSGPLTGTPTLAAAYGAGCPAPFADLGERLGADGIAAAVARWGLTAPPPLELETAAAAVGPLRTTADLREEAIGQGHLTVSPLQIALVAGTLANGGRRPIPGLLLTGEHGVGRQVIPPTVADMLLDAWPSLGDGVRGHLGLAIAGRGQRPLAWFLGVGAGGRYAVVVLIEQAADPHRAAEIGRELLLTVDRRTL